MFMKTLENINSTLNFKTNLIRLLRYESKQGKNELNIFKLN